MRDRFRGVLVGAAIGDALGVVAREKDIKGYATMSTWIENLPEFLRYSEITRMTLSTCDYLLNHRSFCGKHAARRRLIEHLADTSTQLPPSLSTGKIWDDETAREMIGGGSSFDAGAAVRIAPFAMVHYEDTEQAVEVAREVAKTTNLHPVGLDGAGVHAGALAEIIRAPRNQIVDSRQLIGVLRGHCLTRRFQELLDAAASLDVTTEQQVIQVLGNGLEAHRSVPTALHAFLKRQDSFLNAILYVLSLGGETETIASMTGALSGAALGYAAIPQHLSARLEDKELFFEKADLLLNLALDNQ